MFIYYLLLSIEIFEYEIFCHTSFIIIYVLFLDGNYGGSAKDIRFQSNPRTGYWLLLVNEGKLD